MIIKTRGGLIEVTSESVNDVFGILLGGVKLSSLPYIKDETFVKKWKSQFDSDAVRPSDICVKIKGEIVFDFTFKMNFLMVFANTLRIFESNGGTSTVLEKITEDNDVHNYEWCEFIIDFLRSVKKPKATSFYVGPVVFLTFDCFPVVRMCPSFRSWKTSLLKEGEILEIQNGGLGNVQLRGNDNDEEYDEGFVNFKDEVVENKQTDHLKNIHAIATANKELLLEITLDETLSKDPDNEKILEYFKRFHDLFKHKGVGNVKSFDPITRNVDGGGFGGEEKSSVGGNGGSGNVGGEGPRSVGGNGGSGNVGGGVGGGEGTRSVDGNVGGGVVDGEAPSSVGGNGGSGNVGGECSKEIGGVCDSRKPD